MLSEGDQEVRSESLLLQANAEADTHCPPDTSGRWRYLTRKQNTLLIFLVNVKVDGTSRYKNYI